MKAIPHLFLIGMFCLLVVTVGAAPPVVSNVTAAQRPGTKLVDITYNLADADGDAQTIRVEISGDGGLTYAIPATALSGNVGPGVTPGNNKAIVWNAGADWNGQYVPNAKVRITANDGTTPLPPLGFVYIPSGTFQMGDNLDNNTIEMPVHTVQVDGFFMERYEVSKELYVPIYAWAIGHGYAFSGGRYAGNGHPVQGINWYEAVKWCNARSEKEGLTPVYYTDASQTTVYRSGTVDPTNSCVKWSANGYRLPTEAEWEKAARGGSFGLRYPWGNTATTYNANYFQSADPFETNPPPRTSTVSYYNGSQSPAGPDMANFYGLYDMAGNVSEFCWDFYSPTYYSDATANNNPRGPANANAGNVRILRGGDWANGVDFMRCAARQASTPISTADALGFRCVRSQ